MTQAKYSLLQIQQESITHDKAVDCHEVSLNDLETEQILLFQHDFGFETSTQILTSPSFDSRIGFIKDDCIVQKIGEE